MLHRATSGRIVDVMARKHRVAAASLVLACALGSLIGAPVAAADGADAEISDLQAQGYLVQINWINGASKSLPQCSVVAVNNPSSAPPKRGDTVYVDVECPNHEDD
jgi:hypothetical protein